MKFRVLSLATVLAMLVVSPAVAGDCGGSHAEGRVGHDRRHRGVGRLLQHPGRRREGRGPGGDPAVRGPFTVFAPTDEAFAKLPEGTVEGLLANPEKLKQILLYHVVAGKVSSTQVVSLDRATTVQGSDVTIKVVNGQVMINDAKVIQADVETSNGVIHVIDTVIIPKV